MQNSVLFRATIVSIFACFVVQANGETIITLRDRVEMTKHLVRLGDVAEITSDDAETARELASLPLMPAPVAGPIFLRKREIVDSLAARGIDSRQVTIGGVGQVCVLAARGAAEPQAGRMIESEEQSEDSAAVGDGIRALISNYLKTKSAEAGSWSVSCEVPPRHFAALASATSRPVCQGGAAPWTGRQRFEISFATAAGTATFFVYADVNPATTPVVVTARAMARGEVVTAADVELRDAGYAPKPGDRRVAARSIEALVGMEVRQPMPAGSMVYMDSVRPPLMVRRGDVIQVTSQSGGIRVRTTAKALADRSHGQMVEVEALATKERFDARVVGPGEAVIAAVTTPSTAARTAPIETARLR